MDYKLQNSAIKLKTVKPYKPSFLTEILGNKIGIKRNSVVCDIGTGCGILAILASKLGAKEVYAIDIDKESKKAVEVNSGANNAKNIIFLQGNMLKPLKEKVDVIIANLPQTPSNKKIDFHHYASSDGTEYISELIKTAPRYLKKGGCMFFSFRSITNPFKIVRLLDGRFTFSIVATSEKAFDKNRFERLAKGLSEHIFELNRKGLAFMYFRNRKWYYTNYIIKATLR